MAIVKITLLKLIYINKMRNRYGVCILIRSRGQINNTFHRVVSISISRGW
jgi:hypothetical protein